MRWRISQGNEHKTLDELYSLVHEVVARVMVLWGKVLAITRTSSGKNSTQNLIAKLYQPSNFVDLVDPIKRPGGVRL